MIIRPYSHNDTLVEISIVAILGAAVGAIIGAIAGWESGLVCRWKHGQCSIVLHLRFIRLPFRP